MDKKNLTIVLIAVGIIALVTGGYFLLKDTFSGNESSETEEKDETSSNEEDDELVDIDVNTEGGSWGSDIPSTVPEFKAGNIQSSSTGETNTAKSWVYIFENIDNDDFDDYKKDLEDKGFENMSTYTVDNSSVIMAAKEPYTILVTYNGEEETIGITITEVL